MQQETPPGGSGSEWRAGVPRGVRVRQETDGSTALYVAPPIVRDPRKTFGLLLLGIVLGALLSLGVWMSVLYFSFSGKVPATWPLAAWLTIAFWSLPLLWWCLKVGPRLVGLCAERLKVTVRLPYIDLERRVLLSARRLNLQAHQIREFRVLEIDPSPRSLHQKLCVAFDREQAEGGDAPGPNQQVVLLEYGFYALPTMTWLRDFLAQSLDLSTKAQEKRRGMDAFAPRSPATVDSRLGSPRFFASHVAWRQPCPKGTTASLELVAAAIGARVEGRVLLPPGIPLNTELLVTVMSLQEIKPLDSDNSIQVKELWRSSCPRRVGVAEEALPFAFDIPSACAPPADRRPLGSLTWVIAVSEPASDWHLMDSQREAATEVQRRISGQLRAFFSIPITIAVPAERSVDMIATVDDTLADREPPTIQVQKLGSETRIDVPAGFRRGGTWLKMNLIAFAVVGFIVLSTFGPLAADRTLSWQHFLIVAGVVAAMFALVLVPRLVMLAGYFLERLRIQIHGDEIVIERRRLLRWRRQVIRRQEIATIDYAVAENYPVFLMLAGPQGAGGKRASAELLHYNTQESTARELVLAVKEALGLPLNFTPDCIEP